MSDTHTDLNIPNLLRLRDWLMAGAPHARFDMDTGLATEADCDDGYSDYELMPNACGTVCCIAGAAYMMAKGLMDKQVEEMNFHDEVKKTALEWLGLPNISYMGHPLFNNGEAPKNCTPIQAAEAVQRVIDGKEPWLSE